MNYAQIISVTNQKGGVGKTTTAVNLATAYAAIGKKVLLIDLDPQGNASTGLGIEQDMREITSLEVLVGEATAVQAIVKTEIPNVDLIPATVELATIDAEISKADGKEVLLRNALNQVVTEYDLIFIDTPPSLGVLTVNALSASHNVIVPVQCEFYALEGLAHLLSTIKLIQQHVNPALEIKGILLTMYDKRNRLTLDVENDVRSALGNQVFNTVIPRNVKLSEAPSHGKPVLLYDHKSSGSLAYIALVRELLTLETQKLAA